MMLVLPLLLISSAFVKASALPRNKDSLPHPPLVPAQVDWPSVPALQPHPLSRRSTEMDQTIASFKEQGLCFYYFAERPSWYPDPCIDYCKNNDGHGYDECDTSSYADIDIENGDQSIIETDDDGYRWVPAPCKCSNPDVEEIATSIFDVVAQGLEKIDNIFCAVWVEAFKDILEVGINFIPGGEVLTVAGKAVEGAKTFAENGLEAADFFDNWVGDACGVPDWNFDLWTALLGGPDSLGSSVGCLRKNKSKCKRQDPVPDPSKKSHPVEKSTPTDKTDTPSTESNASEASTSSDDSTTTSSSFAEASSTTDLISTSDASSTFDSSAAPSTPPPTTGPTTTSNPSTTSAPSSSTNACRHGKRVGLKRKGDYFNTIISTECNQGVDTTHEYTITSLSYQVNPQTLQVKATCEAHWDQACYHYSSVISRNPNFATLTCPQAAATTSKGRKKPPKATNAWLSQHRGGYKQVKGQSANSRPDAWRNPKYRKEQSCEMDEYPPAYLLTPDDQAYKLAGKNNQGQMMRWLPGEQNQGAGQMWKGICFSAPLKELSEQQIVDLANDNTKNFGRKPKVINPTSTQYVVGVTVAQRPEFTIAQWDHVVNSQDDGLSENGCWPQEIAPQDPGFTLLTFDAYYKNMPPPYYYEKPYDPGSNGFDPATGNAGLRS